MGKERILITVKTYPTLSRKYGELVCTAGLREDGSWVRLYPVPFRLLDYPNRYQKFDWIETTLVRSTQDPRPESFRLVDPADITIADNLGTEDGWRERRKLVLGKTHIYTYLDELIDAAHKNLISLAVFKPSLISDFIWEDAERGWDATKIEELRGKSNQGELFADENWRRAFQVIQKVPYKFSYCFTDASGRKSELQVLDWEAGQLYWNCLKNSEGDEQTALQKVRQKYLDEFTKTNLHFFMGTTQQFQRWAQNPWMIVGVFPIPHEVQKSLF
ncbi:MAG: hypothetical protein JXA04_09690 [Gammaproteobacteria bacterium]|nr:hypothetical protein [Gammaproteobacteria bacterium]